MLGIRSYRLDKPRDRLSPLARCLSPRSPLHRSFAFVIAFVVVLSTPLQAESTMDVQSRIAQLEEMLREDQESVEFIAGWRDISAVGLGASMVGLGLGVAWVEMSAYPEFGYVLAAGSVGLGALSLGLLVPSAVGTRNRQADLTETEKDLRLARARLADIQAEETALAAGSPILIETFALRSSSRSASMQLTVRVRNVGSKSVKYVDLHVVPYNSVYDPVFPDGGVGDTASLVGPVEPGRTKRELFDTRWQGRQIEYVRIEAARVEFMDGDEWEIEDPILIADKLVRGNRYREAALQIGPRESDTNVANRRDSGGDEPGTDQLIRIESVSSAATDAQSIFAGYADSVMTILGDSALGSAFVISDDGYALTNAHVVADQSPLTALLRDGREVAVRVLRTDVQSDVALLDLSTSDLSPVPLNASSLVEPGASVVAIGTPLDPGLSHSLTKGVVSGVRYHRGSAVIQTDAAVNPGNSGGPLFLDESGEVVGIVSSKLVGDGVEGVAFAVDIFDALGAIGVRVVPRGANQ